MIEIWQAILLAFTSGLTTALVPVMVLKNDLHWVKKILEDHAKRLSKNEKDLTKVMREISI